MDKKVKSELHPRSLHTGHYDFLKLNAVCPELKQFVSKNPYGNDSVDFANPAAVKALNKALLKLFYDLEWDLPEGYLCPPIPGRADYLHYLKDLLGEGEKRVLDIGVGANCIYPLLGNKIYGWKFVGSDSDLKALDAAHNLVTRNHKENAVELRLQKSSKNIFEGVVQLGETFDITMCNPPFHASLKDAQAGTAKKWKNLKIKTKTLNFGGKSNELWYPGGECAFILLMIAESKNVQSKWFTTLVSKGDNLPRLYAALKIAGAHEVKTIDMGQGHKKSRLLAWNFHT